MRELYCMILPWTCCTARLSNATVDGVNLLLSFTEKMSYTPYKVPRRLRGHALHMAIGMPSKNEA